MSSSHSVEVKLEKLQIHVVQCRSMCKLFLMWARRLHDSWWRQSLHGRPSQSCPAFFFHMLRHDLLPPAMAQQAGLLWNQWLCHAVLFSSEELVANKLIVESIVRAALFCETRSTLMSMSHLALHTVPINI